MAAQYARKVLKLLPRLSPDQRRDVLVDIEELAEAEAGRPSRRKRREIVARTCGIAKGAPTSSDEFARRKQAEIALEERRWRR